MVGQPQKDIYEVIRDLGKYPLDAFQFVQEGLSYAVMEVHGEMSPEQQELHKFMYEHGIGLDRLECLQLNGELPEQIQELLARVGDSDQLNRHVSGQHLCWGLRNFALQKFGALASAVLNHWNIRRTRDFGEIVFALVDYGFMQKEPHDSPRDFRDVFDFDDAFRKSYRIDLSPPPQDDE